MSVPRVGVVGVGYMGRLHAAKLAQLAEEGDVDFRGVCDLDHARAEEIAALHGVAASTRLEDLAAQLDAACVAVPTLAHAEVALALLQAGVDVLVEKPLATTREQARALIDSARRGERVLQVGHVERFSEAFRRIEPILNRPRFIEAHRIGPYPARATDVGVVLDLMIHDLDIAARLAGADVERVEAVGVPVLSATEDIANARLRFANGCILNLTASRVSLERLRKLRLFQADAYISIDFGASEITLVRREGPADGASPPQIRSEKLDFDAGDALLAQDRAFARAVAERSEPVVGGEDGYRALDLALRVQESMEPLEDGP